MGEFVAASAFETEDVGAVLAAAERFFASGQRAAAVVASGEPVGDDDVLIFPAANGWTVVIWPAHFEELAAVEFLSRDLGVLASTVSIYDGEVWSHLLVRDGVTLDRFNSLPRVSVKFAGQPSVIADAVGCPVEQVAPYLVRGEAGKAFPDDEFELDSPWVFVDLWRRMGPRYPEDVRACQARLRT